MRYSKKICRFTIENRKPDYKNTYELKKYLSESGKIVPRRITGACAKVQRQLSNSIKQARYMALLPYCDRHK